MSAPGWAFVGTTVGIAALSGALGTVVVAGGLGVATYAVLATKLRSVTTGTIDLAIEDKRKECIKAAELDNESGKALQKEIRGDMAYLDKDVRDKSRWGDSELSKVAAIGVFAFPAMLLAVPAIKAYKAFKNK